MEGFGLNHGIRGFGGQIFKSTPLLLEPTKPVFLTTTIIVRRFKWTFNN